MTTYTYVGYEPKEDGSWEPTVMSPYRADVSDLPRWSKHKSVREAAAIMRKEKEPNEWGG